MNLDKEKFQSALAWCLLGILLFLVNVAAVLKLVDGIDYPMHTRVAYGITWDGLCHPLDFLKVHCYPVWHILTWLTMNVLECKGRTAAAIVTAGCQVGAWASVAWYLSRKHGAVGKETLRVACVCVMFVMPIWLRFFNPNIMIGQGGPNLLHNPTNIMVRFLAIPCFIWCAAIMDSIGKGSAVRMGAFKMIALAALLLLATLSKPSFLQMFLPAMLILAVFKIMRYGRAAIKPICFVAVSFVPVVALIAWQAWLVFHASGPGPGDSGIGIAFLKVWSPGTPNVFVSLLLGNLFPLIVLIWAIAVRKATTADMLAWIMHGVAVAQAAFLYEKGGRIWHGNFFWAHNLALFFIWFTSIDRFISLAGESVKDTAGSGQKCWLLGASAVLSLHLVSGFCYLWRVLVHGMWR